MSLTLEAEQRLQKVKLITFFEKSRDRWKRLAQQSHQFVKRNFPDGATVRPDDVAKALAPLLEVNDDLVNFLAAKKLKQKYWIRDFCDLILDRTWSQIQSDERGGTHAQGRGV